jgi:hypothetical protein
MTGRSKLLASKGIQLQQHYNQLYPKKLTHCGYPIIGRIAMMKRNATSQLDHRVKRNNISNDFVYHQPATKTHKISKISPAKIGKRPIYEFFIDHDNKYYPLRCMLDFGSTSFVISPNAAQAFKIPVVKRTKRVRSNDVTGRESITEGLFTVPIGLSFGNHWSYDEEDHAFEVMETCSDYDCIIPAWYLEKHKARGTTTSHLRFPHCDNKCCCHDKIHSEYGITYDKRVALNKDAIHIGSLVQSTPSMLDQLPKQYHKFLLLFDPEHAEKLPDHRGCDHRIVLIPSEDKLRMGPIYQLSQEEDKILVQYLEKMIRGKKFRPSSGSVGSPILFVPKPNGKGLRLCVDYRHLNDHTKKDKTPLPFMDELSRRMRDCDFITKIGMTAGFHLIRMAMGHEKFTAFRTRFGLYEYMVMLFGLTNAPPTFQREMNRILRPLLRMQLVFDSKVAIIEDGGMVVVVYIDDILIATKGSLEKQHRQVSQVFQLLMDNHMCVEIEKCVFDAKELPFLGFMVTGKELKMDPENAKAIVD